MTAGVYSVIVTDALDRTAIDSIRIYDTFVDERDTLVYKAITIGYQVWMAENLVFLPSVSPPLAGSNTDPYYYVYDYQGSSVSEAKATSYYATYGVLYNWPAAMAGASSSSANPSGVQGACPDGWHLPSSVEWNTLTNYLGGYTVAGGKLKETGTSHWISPNTGATNESVFTALPGGYRISGFTGIGNYGHWWSSVEYDAAHAGNKILNYSSSSISGVTNENKENGFSVRCINDIDSLIITLEGTDVTTFSGNDGSINLTVYGGVSPYTYIWSNDSTSEDISGLSAGVYIVTVSDALDSTIVDSIRVFDTFIDERDAQVYKAITIGDQIWMAENLNSTHYADGTPLVDGTGAGDIAGDYTTKYYFWYDDDSATYSETYGSLYTWAAVMNGEASSDNNPSGVQGVCPDGWHLPGDSEWKELEIYLGMSQAVADSEGWRGTDEGGKLKETDTIHWNSPITSATNESGFTALPGSYRSPNGTFSGIRFYAFFRAATEGSGLGVWSRRLDYDNGKVYRLGDYDKGSGFSVRCVKDTTLPEVIISHAGLTEANLNGALVEMKLINETFNDGTLDKTNFSLNNAPQVTSVNAVNYIGTDSATVILAFDGTDFDIDYDISVTVGGGELTGTKNVTSDTLTITAVIEPATATITHAGLTEGNLNSADIDFTLSNETFADGTLDPANFILGNAPDGTSVSGVTYNSTTNATVTLVFDGTDFDTDITDFSITINGAELSGGSNLTSNEISITATVEILSPENDILSYSFSEQTSQSIIDTINHTVDAEVLYGTDLTNLVATFTISTGASIAVGPTPQVSGITVNDFSSPITYTITAENSTQQDWIVTVTVAQLPSSENDILTFSFAEQTSDAVIDNVNHTITIEVLNSTDLTNLVAIFTISDKATAIVGGFTQESGITTNDFSSPVTYTITAEDLTQQDWIITVTEAATLSSENDILTFSFTEQTGEATINTTNHTIDIEVISGTDLTTLVASFTISTGASITIGATQQESAITSNNFSSSVTYTITAQDDTQQDWVVTVTSALALSSKNHLLTFSLNEQTIQAVIDTTNHTVGVEVVYGTDLTSLIATFTISPGATLIIGSTPQVSGVTANNFSSPIIYTVTAQDATIQDWVITIIEAIALSSAKDFLAFSFQEQTIEPIIDKVNHAIFVEVELGTDLTNLAPTFTISFGASITLGGVPQLSGITANDFSSPVNYTITAQDGSSQDWVIRVLNELLINSYPYDENFENGRGGWIPGGTGSSWQFGTPAGSTINYVASGNNAWVTNLTGYYNPNEVSYVKSPVFDFTNLTYPKIELDIWWHSEGFYDGTNLQYKSGSGSWETVGTVYGGENWYNYSYLYSLERGFDLQMNKAAGWSGDGEWGNGSDDWVTAKHSLFNLGNQSEVRFRITFASNTEYENEGFSYDNVKILASPTGVDPLSEITEGLVIYPNPFSNSTTIKFPNPNFEEYQLIITDISGKVVRLISNITSNKVSLYRDNLSKGFYLIELRGSRIYRGKILIQHL